MKSLKIAIFTPSFLPKCSGAEIFHHNLATRLAARGHNVTVVVPRKVVRALAGQTLGYELVGFPANIWSLLKRWPWAGLLLGRLKLGALQRRYRFDVWHTVVTYPTGVSFIDWQLRSRVPGLLRSVGDDLSSAGDNVGLRREPHIERLVRQLVPQAQAVVALSDKMVEDYLALGVPKERIHPMPNAVDLERFSQTCDPVPIRSALGIGADEFVFLSVGRNHPQKDFPTLLKACALLKERASRPFALVIAGRGSAQLEGLVHELGLQREVHLTEAGAGNGLELPPQSLVDLYRASDAFVMSSLLEGFSSALLEAMAAGLPVVATDVPGIADFVRHGSDATLVPPSDPEALAVAMGQLMESDSLQQDLRTRSKSRAQDFSWEKVVGAYEELYRSLIC